MSGALFCLANASISGGNKAILEYARGLKRSGQTAEIYIWHADKNLDWFDHELTVVQAPDIETAVSGNYAVVFFAKAFLIPLAFSSLNSAKPVFICHDFESAYAATSFDSISLECPPFDDVLRLPIDIITTSRPVQQIISERHQKHAYYVPLAIDKELFSKQSGPAKERARKRILMVGDHLLPTKGIRDGLRALKLLNDELPVELVLITREHRGQQIFENLGYPCEIHIRPDAEEFPHIYASCDAYCCTSWYEGFGLPALEAFRMGIPVVSTRNSGVTNYGIDEENLLLCNPNDPTDLCQKLRRVLKEEKLRNKLIEQGEMTEDKFNWELAVTEFLACQQKILTDSGTKTRVTESQLEKLLVNLEEGGLYTPHAVHIRCSHIFHEIDKVLMQLTEQRIDLLPGLEKLQGLRDELKPFLAMPGAEYYKSCKKRYDLCQLVIGLADDHRFLEHLSKLIAQLNRLESAVPAADRNSPVVAGSSRS